MIVITNGETGLNKFLKDPIQALFESEKVLFTENRTIYKNFNGRKFFGSAHKVKKNAFGLAYIEQNFISHEIMMLSLASSISKGIIFEYFRPYAFKSFFDSIEMTKAGVVAQERVKERIDAMKESFDKEKELWRANRKRVNEEYEIIESKWKEECSVVKQANKDLIKEWQEAVDAAPENIKKFIAKPEEQALPAKPEKETLPPKPEEPKYPDLPKVRNFRDDRLDSGLVWKILRRFRYCSVEGSHWGLLIRREEDLNFSNKLLLEANFEEKVSKEFFEEFIKQNDLNLKNSNNIEQDLVNVEAIELVCGEDDSFLDLTFSEENDKTVILPPLTKIKPMHAASMLAGGIGEYYKEVVLDNEPVAIKAAIVKELTKRTTIQQGKEIEETIELNNQKLGVYNLMDFSFRLLG